MDLNTICGNILGELESKNAARDHALHESRAMIRFCANSIRAVHRGEFDEGERLRAEARRLYAEIDQHLRGHPDLYYAGYVQDAHKELAEAYILSALVEGKDVPTPEDLGLAPPPSHGWGRLWASCAASSSTPSGVGHYTLRGGARPHGRHLLLPDHGGLSRRAHRRPSPDHRLVRASWETGGTDSGSAAA